MPAKIKTTLLELVQNLDPNMTLQEMLYELVWVKKERERLKAKEQRRRDKNKKTKTESPAATSDTENSCVTGV